MAFGKKQNDPVANAHFMSDAIAIVWLAVRRRLIIRFVILLLLFPQQAATNLLSVNYA